LPGNRYLSGIKSRENGGARANQLRLDDSTGRINA
jgi:type VI secretion system secreted protein VgrG